MADHIKCMYCGADLVLPDEPGPVQSCDCGWILLGALVEDAADIEQATQ